MKFRYLNAVFFWVALLNITSTKAGVLEPNSYISNDANDKFWTNLELGVDVMRLSWSHFLTDTGQKGSTTTKLQNIENYLLSSSNEGWQWATDSQFDSLYQWFDTSPLDNGWSIDQEAGSNIFFQLNGFAPMHGESGYRDDIGLTSWYWFSNTESTYLREATIQDFYGHDYPCTSLTFCNPNDDFVERGYHNQERYVSNKESLLLENVEFLNGNTGALLIRKTTQVPEPSTLAIFALGLMGLASRRLKSNNPKS